MAEQDQLTAVIADDAPVMIELLQEILGQLRVTVIATAADGNAAEKLLREAKADLAFLDIEMPGQTGLDVLTKVRANRPDMDCIIVSGQSSFDTLKQALSLGANGYVVKPLTRQKISQVIDTCRKKRHPELNA